MSILPNNNNADPGNGGNGNSLMIDLRNVDKYYQSAAGDYHALKTVDLAY